MHSNIAEMMFLYRVFSLHLAVSPCYSIPGPPRMKPFGAYEPRGNEYAQGGYVLSLCIKDVDDC